MTSFYNEQELSQLGLKSYGNNVLISRKCSIYSPEKIAIGDNVRIDDFCILSGNISIGSHIHISAYSALYGSNGIIMEDYTGMSPRTTIYSAMDDFSGDYLIGPIHPKELTNITGGMVRVCRYSQLGANSIMFPSSQLSEGSVLGAMSLLKCISEPWSIYAGIPATKIKERSRNLLNIVNK